MRMASRLTPTSEMRMLSCLARFISMGVLAMATWPLAMQAAATAREFFSMQLPRARRCPRRPPPTAHNQAECLPPPPPPGVFVLDLYGDDRAVREGPFKVEEGQGSLSP